MGLLKADLGEKIKIYIVRLLKSLLCKTDMCEYIRHERA